MSMPVKILPLITPEQTIETILKIEKGFIIVGGPNEQVWGTLDFQTMFIWTSKESVTDFINNNNLDPNEEKVVEKSLPELIKLARELTFTTVRFDFQSKGIHPDQAFVNYRLNSRGILDLLAKFHTE